MPERGTSVNGGNRPPRGNGEGVAQASSLPNTYSSVVALHIPEPLSRPRYIVGRREPKISNGFHTVRSGMCSIFLISGFLIPGHQWKGKMHCRRGN
uniref:Uncharacterized protein n=1 Tax=Candidatus Kentrum sp. LPFa TaxID=2126335 RepID=A0A450WS79_9GAMM|nr:MAG: hypothetical protein BECKLPF1236B_GA0070989_11886 [Candidatus Kentron sp. LPFa]